MASRDTARALCVLLLALIAVGAVAQGTEDPDAETVLVAGDPPLTLATVKAFTATLEWALDAKFTEEQAGLLKAGMVDSWEQKATEDIEGTAQIIAYYTEAVKLTEAQQAAIRQALQDALLDGARKDPDSDTAKLLLGVYDAAHKPIAQGEPPLTRQMTDAYAELLIFVLAQGADRPELTPTDEFRDGFAQEIAGGWEGMDKEGREEVAQMPSTWAALRLVWEQATEEQRDALRAQWREGLKPIIDKLPPKPEPQAPATTAVAAGEPLPLQAVSAAGYEERAKAYKEAGRNQEAIADLLQALKLEPRRVSAIVALGDVYRAMDDRDKAIDQYLRAVALDPKQEAAYSGLHLMYQGKGDAATARKYWNEMRKVQGKGYSDADWSLAEMARIQAQAQHFQMMSNIMRMQHETSMTIINNIGGWSTTWRRW
jgi:tetratricopeptide (TPR) repeat protein